MDGVVGKVQCKGKLTESNIFSLFGILGEEDEVSLAK